jgi:hypothetical protein
MYLQAAYKKIKLLTFVRSAIKHPKDYKFENVFRFENVFCFKTFASKDSENN